MAKNFDIEFRMGLFGKSLATMGEELKAQFEDDIRNLAESAYGMAIAKAQAELSGTRSQYLKDLKLKALGDGSYMIYLEGSSNYIEDGWERFDMKPGMLKSNKKGANGEPWVKTAKDGHKYASVPFHRSPSTKEPKGKDIASAIKNMYAQNRVTGKTQKINKIFTDEQGYALQGKVAVGMSDNPILDGLTKYQKNVTSRNGEQKTQSVYVNFRIVSELQGGDKFIHPGYEGLHAFAEMEEWIDSQLDNIIKAYCS